jgi:hypothetical protein
MTVTLLCKTTSGVQINLDADALHVLSAVLEFTSRLNPRCRQLAREFEPLLGSAALPHTREAGERLHPPPD